MRIDKLTLRNFRSFADQDFEFHPQFNVLIGDNGCGKTGVLEALAIAAGSWLLGIRDYDSRSIRPSDIRLVGQVQGEEITFESQYPVEIRADGWVGNEHIVWQRALATRSGRTSSGDAARIKKMASDADRRVRAGEAVTLPAITYYGTGRLWLQPRDTERKRGGISKQELSRLEGYRDSIDDRISPRELTRWLERQDRIAYQERQETDLSRVVREAMRSMMEHATNVRYHHQQLEVVVSFSDRAPQLFSHLSDGQRNILALAGDLATRMARLNPQFGEKVLTETPGVVLIDEIDLHLHPNWQRHVVRDLRRTFPKVQFIATTHSPQIVSEVQPECLMTLARRGDRITVEKGTQAYGLDTNWILEHLMEVPARPKSVQTLISRVENELEEGELDGARRALAKVRDVLHGDDGDVARLEASINNLEALANAVD